MKYLIRSHFNNISLSFAYIMLVRITSTIPFYSDADQCRCNVFPIFKRVYTYYKI